MGTPQNTVAKITSAPMAHDSSGQEVDSMWAHWIDGISLGDESSLVALYDASISRVYAVALRITRNVSIAEEVAESVFFQVWSSAKSFDASRSRPLTWLLMICRSRAIARLRMADMALPHLEEDCRSEPAASTDMDPQSILLAVERDTVLHGALNTLCARDRQLLALAFFRGLTYAEIAAHMKMPLGSVKSCIRHALQSLRRKLHLLEPRG